LSLLAAVAGGLWLGIVAIRRDKRKGL
jgi:hypothetical protein